MKRLLVLFLLFSSPVVLAQDFESRFFTITDTSLPQILPVEESMFFLNTKKISFSSNLGLTPSNYWQPNSIIEAFNKESIYLNRKNTVKKEITAESQGFFRPTRSESSIQFKVEGPTYLQNSRLKNAVYRDVSRPFFPFYSQYYY